MERTVDILICHYSGDDIKTLILRDMKQLLAELNDRISFMGSSKESAQSELANFHKENPDFLAIFFFIIKKRLEHENSWRKRTLLREKALCRP